MVAALARDYGARSSRERPAVTLLTHYRVGGLGLRPRHARSRTPPDLRPAAGRKKSLAALFNFVLLFPTGLPAWPGCFFLCPNGNMEDSLFYPGEIFHGEVQVGNTRFKYRIVSEQNRIRALPAEVQTLIDFDCLFEGAG